MLKLYTILFMIVYYSFFALNLYVALTECKKYDFAYKLMFIMMILPIPIFLGIFR